MLELPQPLTLACMTFISVLMIEVSVSTRDWSSISYPDPQIDTTQCGRKGAQSSVCDPDELLTFETANMLDDLINDIEMGTPPFQTHLCGNTYHGFQIRIALMRSFALLPVESVPDGAARMAWELRSKWKIGNPECDDSVLVLVVLDFHQVHIAVGGVAVSVFTSSVLEAMTSRTVLLLYAMRYDDAVERLVTDIGLTLAGQPLSAHTSQPLGGGGTAHTSWGSGGGGRLLWAAGVIFSVIFLCVAGSVLVQRMERNRYKRCKAKIRQLSEEQASFRRKGQSPKSCPVCLEQYDDLSLLEYKAPDLEFQLSTQGISTTHSLDSERMSRSAPPPKTKIGSSVWLWKKVTPAVLSRKAHELTCGHALCEACWSRSRATTSSSPCPICTTPTSALLPPFLSLPPHPPNHSSTSPPPASTPNPHLSPNFTLNTITFPSSSQVHGGDKYAMEFKHSMSDCEAQHDDETARLIARESSQQASHDEKDRGDSGGGSGGGGGGSGDGIVPLRYEEMNGKEREMQFRLRSLQKLYPTYITAKMVEYWSIDIHHHRDLDLVVWHTFMKRRVKKQHAMHKDPLFGYPSILKVTTKRDYSTPNNAT